MDWKDRSRWCGLPIRSTSYELDGNKLYVRKGYISNKEEQLLLHRVTDISLQEGILDKLFKQGTIFLRTTDPSSEVVIIHNVANPREVREMISDKVEEERTRLGVVSREFVGYGDIREE